MQTQPPYGEAETVAPDVRRILAPNPSPMTFHGTNTYLLGHKNVAVIDPGPDDAAHLTAILAAVPADGRISHVFVTHSHRDHSALVPRLAAETGAPVFAFGDSTAGARTDLPEDVGGGEGVDKTFAPTHALGSGETVEAGEWALRAEWTPGHMGNHMCFFAGEIGFTGDLVMGWATSMVSPPDGDLAAFMASLEKLRTIPARLYLPGHGGSISEPAARVEALLAHRRSREAQIRAALQSGGAQPGEIARRVYTDVDPALLPAATRNVLAHLIELGDRGLVTRSGPHGLAAIYNLE